MTKIEPVATIVEGGEVDLDGVLINAREIDHYHEDINELPIGERLYTEAQMRQFGEACAAACEDVGKWPSLQPKHCAETIRELIKEMLP